MDYKPKDDAADDLRNAYAKAISRALTEVSEQFGQANTVFALMALADVQAELIAKIGSRPARLNMIKACDAGLRRRVSALGAGKPHTNGGGA